MGVTSQAPGLNQCKPPFQTRREGKRVIDPLLFGNHAAFCIIRIALNHPGIREGPVV